MYFDAVMTEKSSTYGGRIKDNKKITIPEDIRDLIKQKMGTWENPRVANIQLKSSDAVEDKEGNYMGTAEFYDKSVTSTMPRR